MISAKAGSASALNADSEQNIDEVTLARKSVVQHAMPSCYVRVLIITTCS
jgi:hypothetical protein